MKLFQIEEPEGAPLSADGPGAAVGIDVSDSDGAVAIALGGNAEILPDAAGDRRLVPPRLRGSDGRLDPMAAVELLQGLRGRAERQLHRPVTHAVIAAAAADAAVIETAAAVAELTVLRLLDRAAASALADGGDAAEAPVRGAACQAEDLAPAAA